MVVGGGLEGRGYALWVRHIFGRGHHNPYALDTGDRGEFDLLPLVLGAVERGEVVQDGERCLREAMEVDI